MTDKKHQSSYWIKLHRNPTVIWEPIENHMVLEIGQRGQKTGKQSGNAEEIIELSSLVMILETRAFLIYAGSDENAVLAQASLRFPIKCYPSRDAYPATYV